MVSCVSGTCHDDVKGLDPECDDVGGEYSYSCTMLGGGLDMAVCNSCGVACISRDCDSCKKLIQLYAINNA